MAITEAARRNHDLLFPQRRSTLADTDPELVEVFDNWAFDEVLRDEALDVRTRLMVQLAALIASQALGEFRVMLGAALEVGVTPVEVKEIVYQAVPYLGMGKTFDFLHGTVVFFSMMRVKTPPAVSTPRESGVTSRSRTSLTSPFMTPPWMAAPTATTSSGLTPLCGSRPK